MDIAPPHGSRGGASCAPHGTRVPPLLAARVVEGLRLGSALRSQRLANAAMAAAQGLLCDPFSGTPSVSRTGLLPSRQTLQRGRLRLDVAAMLCRRWLWSRERRPVFRYLSYDASPQGGVEVFATV